ncbi:hypothetical protein [Metabacillus herbersteinensis]|uniref:hypothetical protein n=1 Tax=Metabacillus herbersteinensis TaxID=283816 RepID=UPI00406BA8E6
MNKLFYKKLIHYIYKEHVLINLFSKYALSICFCIKVCNVNLIKYYFIITTGVQNLDLQLDALKEHRYEEIFTDEISGGKDKRQRIRRCSSICAIWQYNSSLALKSIRKKYAAFN